jgi:hypothetical protein
MNFIYEIFSNFDLKIMAKYVWWSVLLESKYKEQLDDNDPIESDYFHPEYFMEIDILSWKYWGDFLFIWINFLIKKSLYDKMVENWFVNWYKTFKVINTVKWWPEYVGIVVQSESIRIPKENIKYIERPWWLSPNNFIWIKWMENWNDLFLVRWVWWTYISEKLYNFLQENADVWNVEFKQIECI